MAPVPAEFALLLPGRDCANTESLPLFVVCNCAGCGATCVGNGPRACDNNGAASEGTSRERRNVRLRATIFRSDDSQHTEASFDLLCATPGATSREHHPREYNPVSKRAR